MEWRIDVSQGIAGFRLLAPAVQARRLHHNVFLDIHQEKSPRSRFLTYPLLVKHRGSKP